MRSAILRMRHVLEALGDEQIAGRVENGAPDGFPVAFVAFFDTHQVGKDALNSVRKSSSVRRARMTFGSLVRN